MCVLVLVGSWFISPLLSGITSVTLLLIIKHCILLRADPVEAGLFALPIFYSFTILVNVFSIIHDGPKLLYMDNIPIWLAATISLVIALVFMIVIKVFIVPCQRKIILAQSKAEQQSVNFNIGESTDTSPEGSPKKSNRNSQISDRQLSVISEQTEMLPLEDKSAVKYKFLQQHCNNMETNGYTSANDGDSKNGKELIGVESTATISGVINQSLSPNSSAVPLIISKSSATINMDKNACAVQMRQNQEELVENKGVSRLFSFLQVLTATFGSFAHGGNDVSNAIGPLIALWLIYSEGSVQQKSETPLYILLYGGCGISLGLWVWGRRVIETIGEDLTKITPST